MKTITQSRAGYVGVLVLLTFLAAGTAYIAQAQSAPQAAAATVHHVALVDGEAFPNELVILFGEQVQFDSKDGKTHDISSGKGNDYEHEHEHVTEGAASGHFGPDEAFLVSFSAPGTYYFHDHYNPDAFITVLVYQPEG